MCEVEKGYGPHSFLKQLAVSSYDQFYTLERVLMIVRDKGQFKIFFVITLLLFRLERLRTPFLPQLPLILQCDWLIFPFSIRVQTTRCLFSSHSEKKNTFSLTLILWLSRVFTLIDNYVRCPSGQNLLWTHCEVDTVKTLIVVDKSNDQADWSIGKFPFCSQSAHLKLSEFNQIYKVC